jgi:hypothetical protein
MPHHRSTCSHTERRFTSSGPIQVQHWVRTGQELSTYWFESKNDTGSPSQFSTSFNIKSVMHNGDMEKKVWVCRICGKSKIDFQQPGAYDAGPCLPHRSHSWEST